MDTAFPPSPQWHQPHSACLFCISEDAGWLLYSLNSSIHILNPFTLKYEGIMDNGHTAKINAIAPRPPSGAELKHLKGVSTRPIDDHNCETDNRAFKATLSPNNLEVEPSQCPPKSTENTGPRKALIASVGDDLKAICWDITTRRAIATSKKAHQKAIKAVEWTGDGNYIVSELLDQNYTLLASGSADQTIRVWNVEKETSNHVINVPEMEKKQASYQRSNTWVPVAWTSKGQEIVSCTSRGTMVRWSLDRDTRSFTKVIKGKVHNRIVYQVMTWPLGDFAFTISMDRKIIAWDMESGQGVAQIECIGGNVYTLDISLLDPGRIVMGLGNEAIKVWNTLSQDEPYESVVMERLQSRVRAVKWHPAEEEKICYGLENGKIGMVEDILGTTSNQSQKQGKKGKHGAQAKNKICQRQTIFQSYHEGAIVSMAWCTPKVFEAPVPELFDLSLRDSSYCIVSCGVDGKILVTDSTKPTSKSLDLDVVLQRQNSAWYQSYRAIKGIGAPGRRDFAIHPSEELIAIGNDDGSVEVYELQYFKLVYVYQGHGKRVNRVKWNWLGAEASAEHEGNTIARYLLASGSDDGSIAIHRLDGFSAKAIAERRQRERQAATEKQQDTLAVENEEGTLISPSAGDTSIILPTRRVFAYFSYHARGVSDLTWSPHDTSNGPSSASQQKLVSVSYDGKAIVYELQLDDGHEGEIQVGQIATECDRDEQGTAMRVSEETTTPRSVARQHKVLACFSRHEGQILSVHWSMSDVDRIYSGGNDWRVCYWDWKSHTITDTQLEKLRKDSAGSNLQNAAKVPSSTTVKATFQVPSMPPGNLPSTNDQQLEASLVAVTEDTPQSSNGGISERQNSGHVAQRTAMVDEASLPMKRGSEVSSKNEPMMQKRARTGRSNVNNAAIQPPLGNPTATPLSSVSGISTKCVNLFPSSSATFRFQTKEKVHLEIIRLTRNLYCRRLGQGGILISEEEHAAARERWRAMLNFFEKDKDEDGRAISSILGSDVDEMNLDDNEDDGDIGNYNGPTKSTLNSASLAGGDKRESGVKDQDIDTSIDDSAAANSDLIFYGSRESIKALAEMEAQEVVKVHSGTSQTQHHSNVFAVGSGLGVLPVSVYKDVGLTAEKHSRKIAQLGQIPVNFWMGDVQRMVDILSSLSENELGVQDWIGIALSPMGGVAAWREMMSRTAMKFEKRGEVHASALCYLGIGRVFEAVDVYRKQELYREALMLLRIRLWEDEDEEAGDVGHEKERVAASTNTFKDISQESAEGLQLAAATKTLTDLHIQILTEWGQQLERRSSFEQACKCQLTLAAALRRKMQRNSSIGRHPDRAEVMQATPSVGLQTLARRGDIATLRTVAGLAILLGDPSRQERVARYESALAHHKKLEKGSGVTENSV
ncbi:Gem-associated protein 5 [Entomortierella chlamydospora]|uniref:Gem-associated protein 5 n=1 Tax=Entomortierella chlamydospora TaxID=101097 RepID=A0A9P6MYN2_9FUNG|nr:Gem-associated protein 5 [Entomortierella chlamydospora]